MVVFGVDLAATVPNVGENSSISEGVWDDGGTDCWWLDGRSVISTALSSDGKDNGCIIGSCWDVGETDS